MTVSVRNISGRDLVVPLPDGSTVPVLAGNSYGFPDAVGNGLLLQTTTWQPGGAATNVSLTVALNGNGSITANITGAVTLYADSGHTNPVTFPQTITVDTTYYAQVYGVQTLKVSLKDSLGYEHYLAGTANLDPGSPAATVTASSPVSFTVANAAPLAQSGQTPSQAPVAPAASAAVGSLAVAAHADHVHASMGLYILWGNGADGDVVMDGTNTYSSFASKSGNIYTLTRPIAVNSLTVNNGVTLNANGFIIFCKTTATINGIVSNDGGAAAGSTAGAAAVGGGVCYFEVSAAGANGGTGAGSNGSSVAAGWAIHNNTPSAGTGGTGSSGSGGTTGSGPNGGFINSLNPDVFPVAFTGQMIGRNVNQNGGTMLAGAPGAGAGGGDGTNSGGGGGGGGGVLIVNTRILAGSGSVHCNGGNGGTPSLGNTGGGGGGAGGVCIVNTADTSGWSGTVAAAGGTGGPGHGTGTSGGNGGAGYSRLNSWG